MEDIKTKAIEAGLCQEHIDTWEEKGIPAMVDYYMANPDWCMERKFPDCSVLARHRDNAKGLYAKQQVNIHADKERYVLNSCTGKILVGGTSVVRIYVGLDSVLDIQVQNEAIVFIDCYDESKVHIRNNSSRTVRVYRYGIGESTFEGNKVIIKDKGHGKVFHN